MTLRTNLPLPDDLHFQIDYVETGSSVQVKTGEHTLLCLDNLPPQVLVRLRDALDEEVKKGARKNPFEKRK